MKPAAKWLAWAMTIAGALIGVVGLAFIWLYFWEGIIVRIGEPDQSLAFWYLPILFIGLMAGGAGLALLRRGLSRLRRLRGD